MSRESYTNDYYDNDRMLVDSCSYSSDSESTVSNYDSSSIMDIDRHYLKAVDLREHYYKIRFCEMRIMLGNHEVQKLFRNPSKFQHPIVNYDINYILSSTMNKSLQGWNFQSVLAFKELLQFVADMKHCSRHVLHSAYCFLAEVCFCLNIRDSQLVASILEGVFRFQYNSLLWKLVFKRGSLNILPQSIFPMNHRNKDSMEDITHVPWLYYAYHAHNIKMVIGGRQFADFLFRNTVGNSSDLMQFAENSHLLLSFLRFGVNLEERLVELKKFFQDLIIKIAHLVTLIFHTEMTLDDRFRKIGHLHELSQVGNIILRSIRRPPADLVCINIGAWLTMNDLLHCIDTLGPIPKLKPRLEAPPELKHQARCTIREILQRNYELPLGIHRLPLPILLQRYLGLFED